jgi:hypothetical protein
MRKIANLLGVSYLMALIYFGVLANGHSLQKKKFHSPSWQSWEAYQAISCFEC